MNRLTLIAALVALTSCTQSSSVVRITQDQPVTKPQPAIKARNEPVFYNGKIYQVAITPDGSGTTMIAIAGMNDKQAKDANGLGTSAFQHFSCRQSQKARLLSPPTYANSTWNLAVRCG